jgi:acyl-coenzyme A synthetase/AMP-(fatty) acid ligase
LRRAHVTRSDLDTSTNRLARAYAERGVGVGDYVTIVLPNSIEFVQAAVACWKLGAVMCTKRHSIVATVPHHTR